MSRGVSSRRYAKTRKPGPLHAAATEREMQWRKALDASDPTTRDEHLQLAAGAAFALTSLARAFNTRGGNRRHDLDAFYEKAIGIDQIGSKASPGRYDLGKEIARVLGAALVQGEAA